MTATTARAALAIDSPTTTTTAQVRGHFHVARRSVLASDHGRITCMGALGSAYIEEHVFMVLVGISMFSELRRKTLELMH